jgi:hypothetical protein
MLSAIHWILGMIFFGTGILGLLKVDPHDISGIILFKLVIGALIIVLGILFAKNIVKPSQNSFDWP